MSSSLDQLSSNLTDEQCKNLREFYPEEDVFQLLRRKGVYPYEYMNDWKRFDETCLPLKESFYSQLNLEEISDKDYEHAEKVFRMMKCKDLGDYHDVYLASDTLLLVDIFETFRDTCLSHYSLDPAQFYTGPALAWGAALKITEVKLELLTDPDMLLMFEKGIRGGICQSVHRHARANNPYMVGEYNSSEETSYIQYLDANNLYGWAMSQKLPTGRFSWMRDDFVNRLTPELIEILCESEQHGYLLEVDVDYPSELHDAHNDLPFLVQRMKTIKVEKLVPHLGSRKKYVVNIKTLDQALKHGLILKKVHRAIQFNQRAWLKPYIDLNTKLRTKTSNKFEQDFFKQMNNSVFGRTMMNIRNHLDLKLVTNKKSYFEKVKKPNFKGAIRFSENLIAVEMGKTCITMTNPVYLGQTILDLSKTVMYNFHYDYIKPKYGDKAQLCYMDTDSFIYYIKTEDFYRDIADDVAQWFDTSNYDPADNRPLPVGINKKVPGIFKDEAGGKIIKEHVSLTQKMHAQIFLTGEQNKKCKGIKRCVVDKTLTFNDYKKSLFDGIDFYRNQHLIQNKKHEVFTLNVNKLALNRDDDKRIIGEDQISTLARGHYRC